jgi:hypothetical protein
MNKAKCDITFGDCVYCGKHRPVTDDHIPPKNLYPKPRPQLLTVPSCYPCNNGASKDDEYFRLNIIMREDTPEQPDAKKVFEKTMRSLGRHEAIGFRNDLLNRVQEFKRVTKSGIYLGKTTGYNFDLNRIEKVVNRIVKGLFYIQYQKRIPESHIVDTVSLSNLENIKSENELRLTEILDVLFKTDFKFVGKKEIFSYWHVIATSSEFTSVWLTLFYQKTPFLTFVTPKV